MRSFTFVAAAVAVLSAAFMGGNALAAPQPGTGGWETFPCQGSDLVLVTQDHGTWAPGFILGTHGQKVVPYAFIGLGTDTVTGETFDFSDVKPEPRSAGERVSCSAHFEEVDPESGHLFTAEFTAYGILRGK
jgi:hypothetical protein